MMGYNQVWSNDEQAAFERQLAAPTSDSPPIDFTVKMGYNTTD